MQGYLHSSSLFFVSFHLLFSFSFWMDCDCGCVLSHFHHVQLATTQAIAHQAPLSLGFFSARLLEKVAIPFSRGSSWLRDPTVSSVSYALQVGSLPLELSGNPWLYPYSKCILVKKSNYRGLHWGFNIYWIIKKARWFQKNIYFCFIDYAKSFDCVDHNKLWKILKEMGIPDRLICLLRNLYASQESMGFESGWVLPKQTCRPKGSHWSRSTWCLICLWEPVVLVRVS